MGAGRRRKGLLTTSKSKTLAVTKFKSLIESHKMKINSKLLVSELKNYIRGGGSFQAKQGCSDDLISAALICIRIMLIVKSYEEGVYEAIKDTIEDEYEKGPLPVIF